MQQLQAIIESAFEDRAAVTPATATPASIRDASHALRSTGLNPVTLIKSR